MRIDLQSLELLLVLAERGGIGAAARALGISQPAVTTRLQALERHVGLQLVERSPRGSRLTAAGVTIADWAAEVLAASDRLEAGIATLREDRRSRLRVSASMTISECLVPQWLAAVQVLMPELAVSLRVGNSAGVADDVIAGTADVGFIESSHVPAGLQTCVCGADELLVVVAPGHPWARRGRPLLAAELAATALIVRETGSGTRDALEDALAVAGHTLAVDAELGSTAAIRLAVRGGSGAAVLSRLAVADDLESARLVSVPVEGVDLRRKLRMIWRDGVQLTGPAAELARAALSSAAKKTAADRGSRPRTP